MSIRPPFARVERRSLTDQVRDRLEDRIMSGALGAGAQIASEETLCREFGVSRPSVREAIRELMALGLVERRGNRAHVVERLPAVRIEAAERIERVRELFETRRAIEVPLTEYAAERASDAQREEMRRLAVAIEAAITIEDLRPLDQAFHTLIAAASGNLLLAELHTKVLEALFDSPRFENLMAGDQPADEADLVVHETASAHTAIAQAIIAADPGAAGTAAREHLDEVERRMVARSR